MAIKFAMPVSHQANTPVAKGTLSFHQPVAGKPSDTVHGIELFVPDTSPGADVFASFDGKLTYKPASGSSPNALELLIDQKTDAPLGKVVSVEGRPTRILYEDVDPAGVRTALVTLLTENYVSNTAHPWLKAMCIATGERSASTKEVLDAKGVDFVYEIVDGFLQGSGDSDIAVLAGDVVGVAGSRPGSPPADQKRRLIFSILDVGDQFINPLYYIYLYAVRRTSLVTVPDPATHPLIQAFATDLSVLPVARRSVTLNGSSVDAFALGALASAHKAPRGLVSWQFTTEAKIDVVGEPGGLDPTAADTSIVRNIWQGAGQDFADLCRGLQIPCEIVTAIASTESGGNPKAYRFEPMERTNLERAQARPDLLLKYDKTLAVGITGYTPTRIRTPPTFNGGIPVTKLLCTLAQSTQLGEGKISASATRSVFLIDDVYRPILHSYKRGTGTTHEVHIFEERFLRTVQPTVGPGQKAFYHPDLTGADPALPGVSTPASASVDVTYTTRRAGLARALRVQLKKKVKVPLKVSLWVADVEQFAVTIPAGKLNGGNATDSVEIPLDGRVSVLVETTGNESSNVDLSFEWYLGVAGAEGVPQSSSNMWVIADGGGSAFGFPPIPEPWVGTQLVRTDRGSDPNILTWDEVATLIDLTQGPRGADLEPGGSFMSPGYMQTLVSTAWSMLRRGWSLASPALQERLGPRPATPADLIRTGWLLQRLNSLFVGLVLARVHYNTGGTKFDLPWVHHWFHGVPKKDAGPVTRWGVSTPKTNVDGSYLNTQARRYNAAVELFSSSPPPAVAPSVRFSP